MLKHSDDPRATDCLNATDWALWAVLSSYTRPDELAVVWALQHTLMSKMGRPGAMPGALTCSLRRLSSGGMLKVERTYVGDKTHNVYTVLGQPPKGDPGWTMLPNSVLGLLAGGEIRPRDVLAYLRWRDFCGRSKWTSQNLAHYANDYGVSTRAAKSARSRLVMLGLFVTLKRSGRPTVTALVGHLPPEVLGNEMSDHQGRKRVIAGARSERTPGHVSSDRSSELRSSELRSSEERSSSVSRSDGRRHLTDATGSATAPAAMPKTSIDPQRAKQPSQTARDVLRECPPQLRRAPQHFVVRLMELIDRYLATSYAPDANYGPDAIVRAAWTVEYSDDAAARHVPALRAALRDLASNVKGGTCCGWCGQDQDRPRAQTCELCNPDDEMTPAQLEALWAAFPGPREATQ